MQGVHSAGSGSSKRSCCGTVQQVLTQIELETDRTRRNIDHFRADAVAAQCENFQCHVAGLWKLLWWIIVYRPQAVNQRYSPVTEAGLAIFILSLSGAFRSITRGAGIVARDIVVREWDFPSRWYSLFLPWGKMSR